MRAATLVLLIACMVSPTLAQSDGEDRVVRKADIPKPVIEAVTCDTEADFATREPFAGGLLWQLRCPSNHANQIAAQVFSRDKDGKDARLIRFPTPHRGKEAWLDEISNVEFFPAAREFNHLFVDPENGRICRTEARWISRDPLKPQLVFWRETKDCDGKRGWRVLVNRKK